MSSEGRGQVDELEMQEVYRWAKDRAAKKGHISNIRGLKYKGVSFQIFRNTDMGVLRGQETCWGRDVATAVVNLECHVVKI